MKSITKLTALLLAASVVAVCPIMAQDATPPATNTAPTAPKPRVATQYRGIIASVDTTNMVLTLKGRNTETKVKITSTTKITKDRQPATFSDAAAGLRVMGSGKKGDDGVWTANTLNITTPPAPKPPPTPGTGTSQ
jgi:hypothetical protein